MARRRNPGFSLIELLVVIAILAVLIGLLVPAVQKVRESAARTRCANNLKQLGIALHDYETLNSSLPPGVAAENGNEDDGWATGFTYLLPHIEQSGLRNNYKLDAYWYDTSNYTAVGTEVKLFYCPSNRGSGGLKLGDIAAQWGCDLPPYAAGTDYAFCKGSNAGITATPELVPATVRGPFGIVPRTGGNPIGTIRLTDIHDGTSNTIAMGEAAGGSSRFPIRSLTNPGQIANDPFTGQPALLEQSWGATGFGDSTHPWYASVLAVTAQYGIGPDFNDEPMNRTPGTPTIMSTDRSGYNRSGRDYVSGFRSVHSGGAIFLFCDGSVRFLSSTIDAATYRGLSTIAGSEDLSGNY